MKFSRSKPGFVVSTAVHAGLLVVALVVFSDAKKFEDAQEFVPVEIVSDPLLNQMAKGEKTAKPAKPATRIDKVADTPQPAPRPPTDEAKKDVPTPPPPLKRLADPSNDEPKETPPTPPKRVAAAVPAPAPAKEPPKPAPPVKAAPQPEKEEPREAEVVRPKPPTKPVLKPTPAETPPEKPKAKAEPRLKVDEVAKLLQQKKRQEKSEAKDDPDEASDDSAQKPEKTAKPAKPKSGDEAAPKSQFDPTNIANLLSHEKPQQHAAAGPEKTRVASLGAPTATGPKLSPSMQAKIDAYTVEHYRRCWAAGLSLEGRPYAPRVEFRLTRDGALEGAPQLLNPSSNPTDKSRAEQALAAVRRCSPMPIPPDFVAYYDYWRVTELDMREDM